MRAAAEHKTPGVRTEQIILFRASNEIFAISSGSVQEVRSVDSLAGAPVSVSEPHLQKVRHAIRRGEKNVYVVNTAIHFGLRPSPSALIFLLRKSRVALLVDAIEKMTTMTQLQALPGVFCNEERAWYRGLTVLDQNVIPVVEPGGFLTSEELFLLDAATGSGNLKEVGGTAGAELSI
jgi:chemotaxis signal transduction protein